MNTFILIDDNGRLTADESVPVEIGDAVENEDAVALKQFVQMIEYYFGEDH